MAELVSHGDVSLKYEIVISHEQDGKWIAQIESLNLHAVGATAVEARSKAEALALRAVAGQIEIDQSTLDEISFAVWV